MASKQPWLLGRRNTTGLSPEILGFRVYKVSDLGFRIGDSRDHIGTMYEYEEVKRRRPIFSTGLRVHTPGVMTPMHVTSRTWRFIHRIMVIVRCTW